MGQSRHAREPVYTRQDLSTMQAWPLERKIQVTLSASRVYPCLSDADLEFIPKTITDGGNTLTLADVQWANDGTYFTATAKYTGTATSRYATGYTVTADYTGEIAKPNCEIATYTAIFGSTKLEEPELEPTPTPEPTPEPTFEPTPAPEQEQPADEKDSGTDWLSLLGCAGGVAALAVAAFFGAKKIKERSAK